MRRLIDIAVKDGTKDNTKILSVSPGGNILVKGLMNSSDVDGGCENKLERGHLKGKKRRKLNLNLT